MATFADLIADERMLLPDELARQVDDMAIFRQAVRAYSRLGLILFRNNIAVGKAYETITLIANQPSYDLPADFMAVDGVFRGDGLPLRQMDDREYMTLVSAPESSLYLLRAGKIFIASTPQTAASLTLVYWPRISTAALSPSAETPYDGKFDDLVFEYLTMTFSATAGTSNTQGDSFYQDIEKKLLETYAYLNPTLQRQRGWC